MVKFLAFLGRSILCCFSVIGSWNLFLLKLATSFDSSTRIKNYWEQIVRIGTLGIPVIAFMSVFVGGVMTVQSDYTLRKFGAEGFTGSAVALSVIRELSPVLTALMVIGRSGSAVTAEIGVMKITDQLDALRSLNVNVNSYLLAPRFFAFVLAMPILTAFSMVVAIIAGYLLAVNALDLSSGMFVSQMQSAVEFEDVASGLLKAVVFGIIAGLVAVYKGINAPMGSQGVNQSTTESVVLASIVVLISDFILTSVFIHFVFK